MHIASPARIKQYPQGLGRYILGTTEGNTTDDYPPSQYIVTT